MTPILEALAANLRTTDTVLALALTDLNEVDAKRRVRGGTGPSIAWQAGHMLDGRVKALALLGVDRVNPYKAQYSSQAASDGADYPTMVEFFRQWQALSQELAAAMQAVSTDVLEKRNEANGPHGEQTVLAKFAFQVWHEAYHVGALGTIRKELGYPGPAELVMAQMAAAK